MIKREENKINKSTSVGNRSSYNSLGGDRLENRNILDKYGSIIFYI